MNKLPKPKFTCLEIGKPCWFIISPKGAVLNLQRV